MFLFGAEEVDFRPLVKCGFPRIQLGLSRKSVDELMRWFRGCIYHLPSLPSSLAQPGWSHARATSSGVCQCHHTHDQLPVGSVSVITRTCNFQWGLSVSSHARATSSGVCQYHHTHVQLPVGSVRLYQMTVAGFLIFLSDTCPREAS